MFHHDLLGLGWSSGSAAPAASVEGTTRLAACVARFGAAATLGELLRVWRSRCPRNSEARHRKPQKYGLKCIGTIGDLGDPPPPDLPPSLREWTVIEGGKADDASEAKTGRRRG
jgi:hypothetical protein